MKKEHSKEKRKITVGLIFCWIFGVLFFLMGLGLLIQSAYFSGIIVIIGSLLLIRIMIPAIKKTNEKTRKRS